MCMLVSGLFASEFQQYVEGELLIMGLQQLVDTFSTLRTHLRPWLNILSVGANDVSAEEHKSK
jgi:hypothetical protein